MAFRTDQNPADHVDAMRRYARALCRSDENADDLVHDALVRAYEGAGTFRPGGSLRAWLLSIVRNSFLGDLRKRKAEGIRHDRLAALMAERAEPEQEHQAYLRQIVTRFLHLPEPQREVLYLITIEEMSYQEAAAFLDVPIGTVMSRLSRARATLRAIETDAEAKAIGHLRIVRPGE